VPRVHSARDSKRSSHAPSMTKLGHFNSLGKEMNNLLNPVGGLITSGYAT